MLGLSYQKVGCLDSRFGLGGWEKACLIYALLGRQSWEVVEVVQQGIPSPQIVIVGEDSLGLVALLGLCYRGNSILEGMLERPSLKDFFLKLPNLRNAILAECGLGLIGSLRERCRKDAWLSHLAVDVAILGLTILDKAILNKGVLEETILDKVILDKVILEEAILDKAILEEPILENSGLSITTIGPCFLRERRSVFGLSLRGGCRIASLPLPFLGNRFPGYARCLARLYVTGHYGHNMLYFLCLTGCWKFVAFVHHDRLQLILVHVCQLS